MKIIACILIALFGYQAHSEEIEASKKYVFYLHGTIIEKGDLRPVHPQYGLYDYPAILSKLSEYDFHLIAEQRPEGTEHLPYAEKLITQINSLIENGIQAEDITVVGFSKGAMITAMASSLLDNSSVNFAILATCGDWFDTVDSLKELRLKGHILSIYEETDSSGSCQSLANRSPKPSSFKEIAINTGKDHGAFFLPRSEWVEPLITWIGRETATSSD